MLTRYFDALRGVIERHGGTVEKFIGDAVMAVFGIPQLREDDALRAVRAAAELDDALGDLNAELEASVDLRIRIRVGINTGEVMVTSGSEGTLATGDPVNVAARLEQAAGVGEILIGAETHQLVRDAVLADALDPLAVKGKSEPLSVFRVQKVDPAAAGFARRLDAPIVGRQRELSLLLGAFDRSVSDQASQLFTVLGVGGVGKSRLLEAFVVIGMRVRAIVVTRAGRFDDAERTAREQIAIIDETDFIVDRGDARIGLAEVLELAGRRDEAEAAATEALAFYEAKGNLLQADLARVRLERLRS